MKLCKRGHEQISSNVRGGTHSGECLACHRERERERNRAAGAVPRGLPTYPCGHPRTPENSKGGHPACKICHRKKQLARYRADPATSIAKATAWANANRKRLNVRFGEWRRNSPEQRARMHLSKSRRNREEQTVAYAALLKGDPCSYCGSSGGSIDHITPIRRCGETNWTNLTAACGPCNSSKNARPLLQFLLARQPTTSRT